jgi:hypothetical protein
MHLNFSINKITNYNTFSFTRTVETKNVKINVNILLGYFIIKITLKFFFINLTQKAFKNKPYDLSKENRKKFKFNFFLDMLLINIKNKQK